MVQHPRIPLRRVIRRCLLIAGITSLSMCPILWILKGIIVETPSEAVTMDWMILISGFSGIGGISCIWFLSLSPLPASKRKMSRVSVNYIEIGILSVCVIALMLLWLRIFGFRL